MTADTPNDHWEFGRRVVEAFEKRTPEHQQGHHSVRPEPEPEDPKSEPEDYPCNSEHCDSGVRVERKGAVCRPCARRKLAAVGIHIPVKKTTDTEALKRQYRLAQRKRRKYEREQGFRR